MCYVDMPVESLAVLKPGYGLFSHGSKHLAIVFFIYCQHLKKLLFSHIFDALTL